MHEKLKGKPIFVDQFEKIFYQQEEKLKNTVWFGPIISADYRTNRNYFSNAKVVGLIKSFRLKNAKKIQVKTNARSQYLFVEFENEADCNKVTALIRKRKLGVSAKSYVAGSNTFVVVRRSKRK